MTPDKTTQQVAPATPRAAAPMDEAEFLRTTKEVRHALSSANRFHVLARKGIRSIYEREGWRGRYKSWAECVEAEFAIKIAHAHRLITASVTDEDIGPVNDVGEVPECVLRPLKGLPPEKKREAFVEAVKEARESGREVPTQSQVAKAVEKVAPEAVSPRGEKPAAKDDLSSSRPDDPKDVAKARKAGIIPEGATVTVEGENEPEDDEAEEQAALELTDEDFLAECPVREELSPVIRARFDIEALAFRKATPIRLKFTKALRPITNEAKRMAHHIGPWLARIAFIQRSAPPQKWLACKNCKDAHGKSTGEIPLLGPCNGCGGNGYYVP